MPPELPTAPTATGTTTAEAVLAEPGSDDRTSLGFTFWLAVAWLVALSALCALAPVLPFVKDPALPQGPLQDLPTPDYWFGTDNLGRDQFARILYGGRVSLLIGIAVVVFGSVVGGFLGITAGYFRGWWDRLVTGIDDILLSFPALLLALALVSVVGGGEPSIGSVIASLSVLAVAPLARITRATTLTFTRREFVQAARVLGATDARIVRREILPNVVPPMASFALVVVAVVIVAEGALAFLGLSVTDTPSWGSMIQFGRAQLEDHPQVSAVPIIVMFLTILAFNLVGDRLRQRFGDIKEAGI